MATDRWKGGIEGGSLLSSATGSARAIGAGGRPLAVAQAELPRQGPKEVARGKRAVGSSASPIVTKTILDVLKTGGNAADAIVAATIMEATVQIDCTNHTGTVTAMYWDAKTNKPYFLNSMGTLHPNLPPFRTYPGSEGGGYDERASGRPYGAPIACIPGFMPGIAALHARFGSKPWKTLVEYAIPYAEDGFPLDEFTRGSHEFELYGNSYFPGMRDLFLPNGFIPSVGEKLRNPALAKTLRRLADEGPEYFIKGEWAQRFVSIANALGWGIELRDLSSNPPRWVEPIRYEHCGYEIVQPTPPERQGVFCSIVLGILKHLDIKSLGHYTESAESMYYMAQALRRAEFELGQLHDPEFFDMPLDVWMSDEYHARLADIIRRSRPKKGVDLTRHVELTSSRPQLQAIGWATGTPNSKPTQPPGSCELNCIDAEGNWVQVMTTFQSGGIPGFVVDGVPMIGSHVLFNMDAQIAGWLGLPGSRMRSVVGNSFVLKGGKPLLTMGSPGYVHCIIPQVLSNVLDYSKDPYEAAVLPRLMPMRADYTIDMEARIPDHVLRDLAKLGARLGPLPPYDWHMGCFAQAWVDPNTDLLCASTDPRRAGEADGI